MLLHVDRFQVARTQFDRARSVLTSIAHPTPECRYVLARTYSQLGAVCWRLWRRDDATANHRQAVELLEDLVQEAPQRADYRLALADAYQHFGPHAEDSRKYRLEGMTILSKLAEEYPQVPDFQCELSEALIMPLMGMPPEEYEAQLRQAIEVANRISDQYPTVPRYRATCARALHALAALLHKTDRATEADRFFAQATEMYQALHDEFPSVNAYSFFLAKTLHEHGETLRQLNRLDDAHSNLEQAIAHQEQYVEACRQDAFGRGALAQQYETLAKTLSQLGDHQKSLRTLDQAYTIQQQMRRQFRQWQRLERKQQPKSVPQP